MYIYMAPWILLRPKKFEKTRSAITKIDQVRLFTVAMLVYTFVELFTTCILWKIRSRDLCDADCHELSDILLNSMLIGTAVGIGTAVTAVCVWKSIPGGVLFFVNAIILTVIIVANWGHTTLMLVQLFAYAAIIVGVIILWYYIRENLALLSTAIMTSLGLMMSAALVFSFNIPLYRRLDAWVCSDTRECFAMWGSIIWTTVMFILYAKWVEYFQDKLEERAHMQQLLEHNPLPSRRVRGL